MYSRDRGLSPLVTNSFTLIKNPNSNFSNFFFDIFRMENALKLQKYNKQGKKREQTQNSKKITAEGGFMFFSAKKL